MAGQAQELSQAAIALRLRAAGCVFAEDEARLLTEAASGPADLAAMIARRAAGLPLEHVLGWAEFCGLRIAVGPGVFVPRRRSEFLVREAVSLARRASADGGTGNSIEGSADAAGNPDHVGDGPGSTTAPARPLSVVVDLCCGSGAVGAALAAALGEVEVHAVDIDPAAVACARRNLAEGGASAAGGSQVYQGDLYGPLPAGLRGRVAIVVANVPYVPTREVGLLPAESRVHEPLTAVDGGPDGLDVLRRVAAAAPQWLAPGGHLLIETSERQALLAAEAFAHAGLRPRVTACDELGATVVIGERPAPGA